MLMISQTISHESFPVSQFLQGGYTTPYRLDRNSNVGGILVFIREDIPPAKFHFYEAGFEAFAIELNLEKANDWYVSRITLIRIRYQTI